MVKVAVIDSGVEYEHFDIISEKISGINLINQKKELGDISDQLGHGTAICSILSNSDDITSIQVLKIFDNDYRVDLDKLIDAIEYAIYLNVDIINLSLGILQHDNLMSLKIACQKAVEKGIVIVAACENSGEISYPAEWDFVIGVDTNKNLKKVDEFFFLENSSIEIQAFGKPQKVAHLKSGHIVVNDNSYATPHITNLIAKIINKHGRKSIESIKKLLMKQAKQTIDLYQVTSEELVLKAKQFETDFDSLRNKISSNKLDVNKAVMFPFIKEFHPFLIFPELSTFKIKDIYDLRQLGKIGSSTKKYVPLSNEEFIIKDITTIDMQADFDTLILGYANELIDKVGKSIFVNLIDLCIENNKQIFFLDDFFELDFMKNKDISNVTYPSLGLKELNLYSLYRGKISNHSKPIIGVFGTSSSQGKFTTQLWLRKMFLEKKYNVGQLGSEHQSILFGFDKVFPYGYNANINLPFEFYVTMVNNLIHQIETEKDPDLIMLGAQSGTIPYSLNTLGNFTYPTLALLQGANPDLVVLHINTFDDLVYIEKTIKTIESLSNAKVVALVLYSAEKVVTPSGRVKTKFIEDLDKINNLKETISKNLNLPVYDTTKLKERERLFNDIISFFS
ncbi:hypothetical protein COL27_33645 [Bacillus sp. AFS075960]|nr:hypothetical protein COI76_27185 [Bacillus cereus]PFW54322.1 hypothetical protein COL27_33645 [Bacillus sp. AFS075960]PGS07255.1 hypothetical protein COC45_23080 [Bacillus cereus]PGT92723.1 hypothetical protein COD18_13935 [Bacillus cereus]PGU93175.1 hypothetical protein COD71_12925 [Bacillus cereus]